jgi:hypothetical protein
VQCTLARRCLRFGNTHCLHHQGCKYVDDALYFQIIDGSPGPRNRVHRILYTLIYVISSLHIVACIPYLHTQRLHPHVRFISHSRSRSDKLFEQVKIII